MSMSDFYHEVSMKDFEAGLAKGLGCFEIANEYSINSYDSYPIGMTMSMLDVSMPIVLTDSDDSGMSSEWSYPQEIEKTIAKLKAMEINIDFSEYHEAELECCGLELDEEEETQNEIESFVQSLIAFYENALKNGNVVITYIA